VWASGGTCGGWRQRVRARAQAVGPAAGERQTLAARPGARAGDGHAAAERRLGRAWM
jgi:hypothetical protein